MGAGGTDPSLRVGLLGVLTVDVDGVAVDIPGARRRTVLAALALTPGRVVATERLIDVTWPEQPPEDAVRALYNHVSRLRKQLGPAGGRLRTHEAGYRLDLYEDELDLHAARRLGDLPAALPAPEVLSATRRALDLWRGPALAEFRGHPDLSAAAVSLDELRARLLDDLTEARLRLADPSAVVDAQTAAAEQPLRERTALLLVQALARDGRQAEAMEHAAAYRRRLAEETGLDPGPALARLEQEVAAGDHAPTTPERGALGLVSLVGPAGPMVGRDRDREEVGRLLAGHRVVTLTGAGGVGKTRLARQVAAELAEADGVEAVLVDLAAVEGPARVAQAVGSTLLLQTSDDVSASDVAGALAQAKLLLVLDNCEHLIDACRVLVDALAARAPGVRILATSRIVLHSSHEYVVRLQPLPVPPERPDPTTLDRQPSVRAFVEHARRRESSFALGPDDAPPLVEILRRLDGLPLAIEIAAAHATTMPLPGLRDRLALDLAAPGGSSDDGRRGTLRATIRWSYDLLPPPDQAVLRAVASFPGGIDLDTWEHLVRDVAPGGDALAVLGRLVDASLLEVGPDRTRYRLLFPVREFLLEELVASGDDRAAEARFVRWAQAAAAEIGADLLGASEQTADRRLRTELPNLRAARDVARSRGDTDALVEITLALDRPSMFRDVRELWAWCHELADADEVADHPLRTEILGAAAEAARLAGAYDRALDLADRGLTRDDPPSARGARCESATAGVALYRGDFATAYQGWLRAAEDGPLGMRAAYLSSAALAAAYDGRTARARHVLKDATRLAEQAGCPSSRAFARYVSGELVAPEEPLVAVPAYRAAVAEASAVGATFIAGVASVALASTQTVVGDRAAAAAVFAQLLEVWHATGQGPQLWTTARNAAALLLAEGRVREGVLLTLCADRAPDAATVDDTIAVSSGRAHPAVTDFVDAGLLDELRREVETLEVSELLDQARQALLDLAGRIS